ncbi:MAG: hypothetical protein A2Y63_02350 [Candidatus Riflebacteria bacterium RBG_13_59_9]|nr:MAG: hypothetical protein A2Y63_02350 [Candidatus Riflebacteria bacterium RBG_13_59_9]
MTQCGKLHPRAQKMYRHRARMGVSHDLRGRLRLCGRQRSVLEQASDYGDDCAIELMHLYFADEMRGIPELNRHVTAVNQRLDRYTRDCLNPLQDALFPEHEWFHYCRECWNEGYRPGADYVAARAQRHAPRRGHGE